MKIIGKLLLVSLLSFAAAHAWAGITQANDPNATSPSDSSDGCGCGSSRGMPVYSFKSLLASLSIHDTPIGYSPPVGPKVYTTLWYNERESDQPAVFDSFNIGEKWTLNWLTWIQDNPASPGSQVLRYVAGGGGRTYGGYNPGTGAFAPEPDNGAVLVMTSQSPVTYELRFADGSKDIFAASDGAMSYPRKVLLTQIIDPQGNALTLSYDSQLRLTTITDAIGQRTTFQYGDSANPLLVTGISDPFGRQATLSYDGEGRLISITDVIGMTSSFAYDGGTFIQAMTTPYGTTTFQHTEGANGQSTEASIEATDPDGHTERTEYMPDAPGMPFSLPQVPSGINAFNAYLNYRDSYYWDKDAFAAACTQGGASTSCDYGKARMKHFFHQNPCCYYTSRVLEDVKYPLEGMIWYDYAGQPYPFYPGTLDKPSDVERVLSDGSTQTTHYDYNAYGRVTRKIDPDGRETDYTYAPNGIDLIEVEQKSASGFDTLARYTYNAQHEPLSATDAAGETTAYTYNARGQRTSVTDPLGETTSYQYDGNGYLTAVINPLGHTERSFTYDADGRVASDTDSEGYTRRYSYDALDRITEIAYPDGTTTRFTWNNLDLASVTDRQGNTTSYRYDAERDLIALTDPLGRVTRYSYYPNGKLHTMTDASGNVTTWTRDLEGRVIAKSYADGTGELLSYDNSSRLASVTDALGQTKEYSYDRADLLTGIQYANAVNPTAAVSYTYDPYYPRLISLSDGLGTTSFKYVPAGTPGALKLASSQGPFSQNDEIRYAYDALGRVIRRTTDIETDYAYDPLGRLSQESNPLGTFRYGYLGQTDQVTSRIVTMPSGLPGLALTQQYEDNRGDRQLKRLIYRAGDGRLVSMMSYTHSSEHLLTSANVLAPWVPGMSHDADGRQRDEDESPPFADGHERAEGNDGLSAPGGQGDDRGEGDDGHRADQLGSSAHRQRYEYDAAYRLTAVRGHGRRATARFDYDASDNLVSVTGAAAPFTAAVNSVNELATVDGQTWQYDADGQLLSDGVREYAWDAEGRLISVTDRTSGRVTIYRYDGLGRRVEIDTQGGASAATETRYLWCGLKPCQARDGGDEVIADYFRQGELRRTQALDYVRDQLGSVIGLTDASGRALGTVRYGAYGAVEDARGVQPAFGYAGMLRDPSTGLNLTRFRAYDPAVRRWLNRDPIGEAGGMNLYAYVDGDPIDYVDPLGLWALGDPLPPWLVNYSAGLGDALSLGLTYEWRDIEGTNDVVNFCSGAYWGGVGTGVAIQIIGFHTGGELRIGKNFRIAPWGNRTGNPYGELPHYHRRIVGPDGQTIPGGGIGRHRPWEGW